MTPELIAILAVGVGLAGLMWQSMRRMETRMEARIAEMKQYLGARIDGLRNELGARIDGSRSELGARIDGLAEEMREMRDRLGRLEGKMDFVYDYITRRNDPAPAAE